MDNLTKELEQAAEWIRNADSLIITAGAGIGVDSGLPDFRGDKGLWTNYPNLKGRTFSEVANPDGFWTTPKDTYGFYAHRLLQYRDTVPHEGFQILKKWSSNKEHGSFIRTSNVDGHFQKAGFSESRIVEIHGSIHRMQCLQNCDHRIWDTATYKPRVDEHYRLDCLEPRCIACGFQARPNILMFDDWNWCPTVTDQQEHRFQNWITEVRNPVVIEIGAGKAVPTIRNYGDRSPHRLIRINPTDWKSANPSSIGLSGGAHYVLSQLDSRVKG